MTGTVKWFNEKKGYGFIEKSDKSGDVFVHYSAIKSQGFKTLAEGDVVEFQSETTSAGEKATEVVKIK